MLREIKGDLGFNRIELGHGIRISLMPGIQKCIRGRRGDLPASIISVRCRSRSCRPRRTATKSRPPIRTERERAIKQTFQTIDFAERLGAPFVVLHCGEVEMNPITDQLIALAKKGELLSRKYVGLKDESRPNPRVGCPTPTSSG